MAFPTVVGFSLDNLDAGSDQPSLARADLYQIAIAVVAMIQSYGNPSGLPTLGPDGLIPKDQLPFVPLTGDVVPITLGGTGATNAADARTNLGLGSGLSDMADGDKFYWGDPANNNYITFDGSVWKIVKGGVAVFEG